MKVAIFENEYEAVRVSFETANLIHFGNNLEFQIFPSSQSADQINIDSFDVIFIDIDLSVRSIHDGYTLIKHLIEENEAIAKRIVILTGNNKIRESLTTKGIDASFLQILIKPTNYIQITNSIKKIKGEPQI